MSVRNFTTPVATPLVSVGRMTEHTGRFLLMNGTVKSSDVLLGRMVMRDYDQLDTVHPGIGCRRSPFAAPRSRWGGRILFAIFQC